MDASAISLIQDTAVQAQKANLLKTEIPAILLQRGDHQQVESLEPFALHRSYFRGKFGTSSMQDFAQYVIQRQGGDGFIDPATLSAVVFFDLGAFKSNDEFPAPGHARHRALLTLIHTAPFAAMLAATQEANLRTKTERAQFSQKGFIEWLEDWSDFLQADYEGAVQDSSDPTFMRQALTALRKVKGKANSESVHTNKDFGASRSALEDVEASSDVGLPRGFRFTCKPCEDLDERMFYLRLGVIPRDDAPIFQFRWNMRDRDIEAIGQAFKAKLLGAIGTATTMLIGTFNPDA